MTGDGWFVERGDARLYLTEVIRLWAVWLVGLGCLAVTEGVVVVLVAVVLMVALFTLIRPLHHRVQRRFEHGPASLKVAAGSTLSVPDRALRDLTYGRQVFAEAVGKAGWWPPLRFLPWVIVLLTLVAGAAVALAWVGV